MSKSLGALLTLAIAGLACPGQGWSLEPNALVLPPPRSLAWSCCKTASPRRNSDWLKLNGSTHPQALARAERVNSFAAAGKVQPALRSVLSHMRYRRYGLRFAGGVSRKSSIQAYGVSPYVGFPLPSKLDRWFSRRGVRASWMVEAWAAYLRDDKEPFETESLELGINPLLIRLNFNPGGFFSPYLEGGEGIIYIDLRGQNLGTRIQFASQAAGGIELRLGEALALDLSYRYRHLSNLGMASNPGVNTHLGLLGLSYHLR